MSQEGSASVLVLSALLILSALFLGAVTFIELSAQGLARSRRQDQELGTLRQAAADAVQALLSDPTPFADAPTDPVWSWLAAQGGELSVSLEDMSSRLGANWIRKELLQDLGVLRPGRSASELQQYREDTGLHLELAESYGQFLQEPELERMFTAYGWFNLNLTDEFVLRRLHWQRGADWQAAESFRLLVQQARIQKRIVAPDDLPEFLGERNYRLLFPVVNAEAAMNAHFVSQPVLEGLFRHYGQPAEKLSGLLAARQGAELTLADLQGLLRERTDESGRRSPLEPFLGLQTWFWRITVEGRSQRLVWIVARIPREDGLPEYRRLEESR